MNWWKRDWKIWSAITLGALLSWGVYSFVGAVDGPPVNIGPEAQTRVNKVIFEKDFGFGSIGEGFSSLVFDVKQIGISGGVSFPETLGVRFGKKISSLLIPAGTVFYSTSDNCLAVYDNSGVAKSLCGSAPASACSCTTGALKCDGNKLLSCTGMAENCWKEITTCAEPLVPDISPVSGVNTSPYCFQKNDTYAYCKQCVPGQKSCVSSIVEQTCSDEYLWSDKKTCSSGQTCVTGTGCGGSGIPACAENGCEDVDAPQECSGNTGTKICTGVTVNGQRCLQWVVTPCPGGTTCKTQSISGLIYGLCVPEEVTQPVYKKSCEICTGTGRGNCESGYTCIYGRCRIPVSGTSYSTCTLNYDNGMKPCAYKITSGSYGYDLCSSGQCRYYSNITNYNPPISDSNYMDFKCW